MRRILLLMAAPALLAACSSTSPTAAPTVSPPSPAPSASAGAGGAPSASASPTRSDTPVSGVPRCHTDDLSVKLGSGEGAAGTDYESLVFANKSDHRCTLYGYPGVSFVAGDAGNQVGPGFRRETTEKKIKITLAPGAVAHATIAGSDVGFYEASECKPVTVRGYRVYPPDETASIFVARPTRACSDAKVGQWRVFPIATGAGDR